MPVLIAYAISIHIILLLGHLGDHSFLPIVTHFLHALLVVDLSIIILANTSEALPDGQVLEMYSDAMILVALANANECPASLLLLEVKSGGTIPSTGNVQYIEM